MKKKIHIKRYYRKNRPVKAHSKKIIIKRRGIIKTPHKQIFTYLSSPPNKKEYGGQIDFGKKGSIERFTTNTGIKGDEVILLVDYDYEVGWHTHPPPADLTPSPEDLSTLIKTKSQQADIIFSGGKAIIINKRAKAKKLRKKTMKQLEEHFRKKILEASKKSKTKKDFTQAFTRSLEDDGLVVSQASTQKPINVPIRIIEPKRGNKK